jgi:hypothetical protein
MKAAVRKPSSLGVGMRCVLRIADEERSPVYFGARLVFSSAIRRHSRLDTEWSDGNGHPARRRRACEAGFKETCLRARCYVVQVR